MEYNFFQEDPANVNFGADPGYGTKIWFREISKFETIQEPTDTPTEEGDTKIITDTHLFGSGEGFIKLSLHQDGVTLEGETQGEPGFMGQIPRKLKGFVVGDEAPLLEKIENLRNRGVIVLFEHPDCSNNQKYQLGCECDPAVISSIKEMSGGRKTGGKKGFEIEFTSTCRFIYEGSITEKSA